MITHSLCDSYRLEREMGIHDFTTDTFMIALYSDTAVLGPSTTQYTTSGEVIGTGYLAGGIEILVADGYPKANAIAESGYRAGSVVQIDFEDPRFVLVTLSARGALIYNASKQNRAICVIDFGAVRNPTAEDFVIQLPPPGVNTALLRSFPHALNV